MMYSKLSICVLAVATGLSVGVASAANDVKSGDIGAMDKSYGRAGGLVGFDRIQSLNADMSAAAALGVSWDAEVAARTNMPADRPAGADVGVTYDQEVAARTNMPRGTPPAQAAGVAGQTTN